ncbi:hypothetical protein Ancab_004064 [Ancistrocladus abbreviatus]
MQRHNIIKHVDKPKSLASISCDLYPGRKKQGDDGDTKSVLPTTSCREQVQINDVARWVASSDRLSEPLDSDSSDLGKGLEERVGKANLINVNSSLSGGFTASRDIKPVPCCCEMGLSSEDRAKTFKAPEDSSPLSGSIYIGNKRQLQYKDSTVKLGGGRKKMKSKKKQKAKATQDTQIEGNGRTQWQGQTASPVKLSREDRPSVVVQKGEITISGKYIRDEGIQNMNHLFLRKQECDDASFVWEVGKTLEAELRGDEKEILRGIVALEARDRVGRAKLKE